MFDLEAWQESRVARINERLRQLYAMLPEQLVYQAKVLETLVAMPSTPAKVGRHHQAFDVCYTPDALEHSMRRIGPEIPWIPILDPDTIAPTPSTQR